MSDRHDHDDHHHGHGHGDHGHGGDAPAGGDTRFLDLEISQVIYDEAEGVTREAFRELLKEAAKERIRERFGDKIDALSQLAVDELLDDLDANLAIEQRIADRKERSKDLASRARAIFRDDD